MVECVPLLLSLIKKKNTYLCSSVFDPVYPSLGATVSSRCPEVLEQNAMIYAHVHIIRHQWMWLVIYGDDILAAESVRQTNHDLHHQPSLILFSPAPAPYP